MKHITKYKLFENQKDYYQVVIEWEHGDANGNSLERYPFKSEEEMHEFLQFIYEVRKFVPKSGYANVGHFEDGHYERERKWVNQIDKKYNNKFSHLIPNDRKYDSDYTPAVNTIWVEINNQPLSIIWEKALKQNIVDLPKIGDTIDTNLGQISGQGPSLWGRKESDYFTYNDFKHWDEDNQCKTCKGDRFIKTGSNYEKCKDCKGKVKYREIDPIVTDCKINFHEPYERKKYKMVNGIEKLESKYLTHHDYCFFSYILLCSFTGAYITLSSDKEVGFDPNFDKKYHYPKYGTNDFYLVK